MVRRWASQVVLDRVRVRKKNEVMADGEPADGEKRESGEKAIQYRSPPSGLVGLLRTNVVSVIKDLSRVQIRAAGFCCERTLATCGRTGIE